jgi:membrane protease YdiL (CAAX protease family)
MLLDLGMHPIALLIFALLIPLIYCAKWKKKELKDVALLTISIVVIILLYPLVIYLSCIITVPGVGYSLGKFILFVILPIATISYIEKWNVREILFKVGVRKENLNKSIIYGVAAAVITIVITIFLVSTPSKLYIIFHIVMFFEAFTEEFLFRGVLFLYLVQKTNLKVAYSTSIIGFILVHPQHFTSMFILSTTAQAVLLTIVADKTKNVIGPWIGHGLNRVVPPLIRIVSLGI